jgi:hypothetical protein
VRDGNLSERLPPERRLGALPVHGLDEDLHAFPRTQRQVESDLLMDVVVSRGMAILKLLVGWQKSSPCG